MNDRWIGLVLYMNFVVGFAVGGYLSNDNMIYTLVFGEIVGITSSFLFLTYLRHRRIL